MSTQVRKPDDYILDAVRTACFRVYVYDHQPHEFRQEIEKIGGWRYCQWVPMMMGDFVWLWFEFETIEKLNAFIEVLPDHLKKCLDEVPQKTLDFHKDTRGTWGHI